MSKIYTHRSIKSNSKFHYLSLISLATVEYIGGVFIKRDALGEKGGTINSIELCDSVSGCGVSILLNLLAGPIKAAETHSASQDDAGIGL